jgi:hypothetical protein
MTQTLDVHERVSQPAAARPATAPATAATQVQTSKFGTFAITFGIAFMILYTACERMNWPLVTYHPAVNQIYFWMHAARPGDDLGPPMYWYGWLALVLPCAAIVGWIATMLSERVLQRATLFCCTLAVLWPIAYVATVIIVNRPSYDPAYLDLMGYAGIPALIGAAAAAWFIPLETAKRAWTSWLVTLPIGGLVILGYSLKTYFLR